jgi:hypothetical protein
MIESSTGSGSVQSHRRVALAVFSLVVVLALSSVRSGRQIGDVLDTDEWASLGGNLAVHGTLGIGDLPTVYRPPGYPAFIALVLRTLTRVPPVLDHPYLARSRPALYVVQALVLGSAAGAWVLALAPRVGPMIAAATAVALSANPFAVAAVGLTHYTLVHTALLVFGGWGLARALDTGLPGPLVAAGVLWGAITLVRPTSLVLPLVLPLVLRAGGSTVRRPLRAGLWLGIGLLLAVLPWTARNAAVRHRVVPVNAQSWTALWASTVMPLPIRPDVYNWYELLGPYLRVFDRATAGQPFSLSNLYAHDVNLEAAFRQEALANLHQQPAVYAGNAVRSLRAILFHTSAIVVRLHEHLQRPGTSLDHDLFVAGGAERLEGGRLADCFKVLADLLLPVAALGLVDGVRRRDVFLLSQAAVFASLVLAHILTYMDLYYYYVRLPFLFTFAAYGFAHLDRAFPTRRPGTKLAVAVGSSFLTFGICLVAGRSCLALLAR